VISEIVTPGHARDEKDKVAAGVNPAGLATRYERKPRRFSLIARRLRRRAAHFPREGIAEIVSPRHASDVENKVAAGLNPAATATLD